MARVTVTPEQFTMVLFDSGEITRLAEEVCDLVGLPADTEVRVEVDERTPLGRAEVTSLDPITVQVESGAFENARQLRHLSDRSVRDVLGRLLFKVQDRLAGGFGAAPPDADLSLPATVAWNVYAEGRCERAGIEVQKPRWQYHFRNRHGFTDVADEVFERLWSAEGLTWDDVEKACAETEAARTSAA